MGLWFTFAHKATLVLLGEGGGGREREREREVYTSIRAYTKHRGEERERISYTGIHKHIVSMI